MFAWLVVTQLCIVTFAAAGALIENPSPSIVLQYQWNVLRHRSPLHTSAKPSPLNCVPVEPLNRPTPCYLAIHTSACRRPTMPNQVSRFITFIPTINPGLLVQPTDINLKRIQLELHRGQIWPGLKRYSMSRRQHPSPSFHPEFKKSDWDYMKV